MRELQCILKSKAVRAGGLEGSHLVFIVTSDYMKNRMLIVRMSDASNCQQLFIYLDSEEGGTVFDEEVDQVKTLFLREEEQARLSIVRTGIPPTVILFIGKRKK